MRRLFIILCCGALVACYSGGRKGGVEALAIHDFGPSATRLADAGGLAGFALEVRAPLWFDSLGIGYRLLYADPSRLRDYTRARWAGPPAQLVQQRLMQELPLVPHGQAKARCVLRVEIDEFSQLFSSPEQSRGVLQGRLVVLDRARGKVDGRDLSIEKPAPSADSNGAVRALTAAVDALAAEIVGWEREARVAGRLTGCAG
jgi:ABC-type uncharacterized transport system auxiliary subunit